MIPQPSGRHWGLGDRLSRPPSPHPPHTHRAHRCVQWRDGWHMSRSRMTPEAMLRANAAGGRADSCIRGQDHGSRHVPGVCRKPDESRMNHMPAAHLQSRFVCVVGTQKKRVLEKCINISSGRGRSRWPGEGRTKRAAGRTGCQGICFFSSSFFFPPKSDIPTWSVFTLSGPNGSLGNAGWFWAVTSGAQFLVMDWKDPLDRYD